MFYDLRVSQRVKGTAIDFTGWGTILQTVLKGTVVVVG